MLDQLIALFTAMFYFGGLARSAPRFIAREAAQRGHLHVTDDDVFYGIVRAIFWPTIWFFVWAKDRADVELDKNPAIGMRRSLESQRMHELGLRQTEAASKELDKQLLEDQ